MTRTSVRSAGWMEMGADAFLPLYFASDPAFDLSLIAPLCIYHWSALMPIFPSSYWIWARNSSRPPVPRPP